MTAVQANRTCKYFTSNFEQTIRNLAELDDLDSATQMLITLAGMGSIPQTTLCKELLERVRVAKTKEISLDLYRALKHVQGIHQKCCRQQLWRGVTEDLRADWRFFESVVLQPLPRVEETLHRFNQLLVVEYLLSFYEEELRDLPSTSCTLYFLMEYEESRTAQPRKKVMQYIFDNFVEGSPETQTVIQRFLRMVLHLYEESTPQHSDIMQNLYAGFKAMPREEQIKFLETFVHQKAKMELLNMVLVNTTDTTAVSKEHIKRKGEAVSVDKLVDFFLVVRPVRKAKQQGSDWELFLIFVAHLLQSFWAGADMDAKQAKSLRREVTQYCSTVTELIPEKSMTARIPIILQAMQACVSQRIST